MARVTVRVKLDKEFDIECEATNKDSALDDIIDNELLNYKFVEACLDAMTIEDATYDKPEPDEDE